MGGPCWGRREQRTERDHDWRTNERSPRRQPATSRRRRRRFALGPEWWWSTVYFGGGRGARTTAEQLRYAMQTTKTRGRNRSRGARVKLCCVCVVCVIVDAREDADDDTAHNYSQSQNPKWLAVRAGLGRVIIFEEELQIIPNPNRIGFFFFIGAVSRYNACGTTAVCCVWATNLTGHFRAAIYSGFGENSMMSMSMTFQRWEICLQTYC